MFNRRPSALTIYINELFDSPSQLVRATAAFLFVAQLTFWLAIGGISFTSVAIVIARILT